MSIEQYLREINLYNDYDNLNEWLSSGILCSLINTKHEYISLEQYQRILSLLKVGIKSKAKNINLTTLLPPENQIFLGADTVLSYDNLQTSQAHNSDLDNVLMQLLPTWVQQANDSCNIATSNKWEHNRLSYLDISSRSAFVNERIKLAQTRIKSSANSRTSQFSRSASYMGSKTLLAPYFSEILHTFIPDNSVILDLMCGSGAAAGVFSNSWRTIASDAQQFSQLLGTVQGGGMTNLRAQNIANKVLDSARSHFEQLPAYIKSEQKVEHEFLSSELDSSTIDRLSNWILNYPRIGNANATDSNDFAKAVHVRSKANKTEPYLLFSTYYANLFFGVRQAAEIDSLRFAIDQLDNPDEKNWALGALICSVSSCAFSYGGHFAQPKLDGTVKSRVATLAKEMLTTRGLSVTHEFFVRLTNLATESEKSLYPVETINGPWEKAFDALDAGIGDRPVCVYFDPPYTRDEYSRYYHLLETLVRYDYPSITGKPSIPKRGTAGRFASQFSTRDTKQVTLQIVNVINACIERNWSCLWSYSSSGDADIYNVLKQSCKKAAHIEVFCIDYVHKGQGRHKAKAVKEYAVLIRPK